MSNDHRATHTLLTEFIYAALGVGAVLVALVPATRGMSAVGWLPMWLIAMPAAAWWALRLTGSAHTSRASRAETIVPTARLSPVRAVAQARRLRTLPPRREPVRHVA